MSAFLQLMDMSLADFNVLTSKAEGRDKLARIAQYLARALVGFAAVKQPLAGSLLARIEGHARTVMVQMASARRTHRWCKEIPVIQSIPKVLEIQNPVDKALELAQKVSLAVFMMTDHIGQLKQWKILSGGKRSGTGTVQLGLKFFCFSNAMGAILNLKKIRDMGDKEEKREQKQKCAETVIKHLLLVLQTAHLSRLKETHDGLVGVAGVITSCMDLAAQLPAKAAAAAIKSK
eukprot:TRINITY_DN30534_c0_g1_i1.p1 TRINITY_DN30534_c0_g1~~TRINITY_DN30534_c0_g1_i1.p1  ORF type:complete len:233 (-),score=59.91 TRINITY_DN30534_c0_g1_i1:101-799(-)